jgi:hypothetical protein
MTRPLERLGIAELEAFFKKTGITSGELKDLEDELSFRTTSRAEKLIKTVKSLKLKLKLKLPQITGRFDLLLRGHWIR